MNVRLIAYGMNLRGRELFSIVCRLIEFKSNCIRVDDLRSNSPCRMIGIALDDRLSPDIVVNLGSPGGTTVKLLEAKLKKPMGVVAGTFETISAALVSFSFLLAQSMSTLPG